MLEIAGEHDYRVWRALGLILQGVTLAGLGSPAEGLARTEQGIALYEGIRTPPIFWALVLGLRAEACALAGRTAEAVGLVDQAAALAGERNWLSAGFRIQKGDLLRSMGDMPGAETSFLAALHEAEGLGAGMFRLKAATRLAAMAGEAGREEAAATLRAALETFTEGFDAPDLLDARAVLSEANGHVS
ncbi:MAG: hypothetical protein H0V74_08985 [Chloroflexi bacterium]|nr:hypothetical protein [Chloroflexota bacterium]